MGRTSPNTLECITTWRLTLAMIAQHAGAQFDAEVANRFIEMRSAGF